MDDPIVIYSSIMKAQIERLDSIAHNASNINTPGYLSSSTALSSDHFLSIVANGSSSSSGYINKLDSESSAISYTGNTFDLAVLESGWFGIRHEDGMALTKAGKFKLNSDGILVTEDGYEVLDINRSPVEINGKVIFKVDGTVEVDSEALTKLLILNTPKGAKLTSAGGGTYFSDVEAVEAESIKVVQGALNQSNVDSGEDMVKMMEITRSVESLQRAIGAYDDMLKSGINELGK